MTPPQALEAERAVLGAMILYPSELEMGLEILEANMFYSQANAIIFNRISQMVLSGCVVDTLTLCDALFKNGELEKVGGAEYISSIVSSTLSPAHFEEHANLVEEKAILRKLVDLSTSIIDRTYRAPGDTREFIDKVESEFYAISERRLRGDFISIRSVAHDVFDEIKALHKRKKFPSAISTGYRELDEILTGIHPSDYIVLAGRTSTGKTALGLSIAKNIAIDPEEKDRKGVAIFSLEMSRQQVVMRILSSVARVNAQNLKKGILSKREMNLLNLKTDFISSAPIYIDDTPNLSVLEMRAKARRLLSRTKIDLIIIDYLQLILPSKRTDNRQEEVASISRSLKALARELNVSVLALAQLSRRADDATEKGQEPRLSHLRESGAIEQDADTVLLLWRPESESKKKEKLSQDGSERQKLPEGLTKLIVAKQRNGPTGAIWLKFEKDFIVFDSYEMMYHKPDYEEFPESMAEGISDEEINEVSGM